MYCRYCGSRIGSDANYCEICGKKVERREENIPSRPYADTGDRIVFVLSYFGILFFLPLVVCPNSREGRFHANQSLLLLITTVAGNLAIGFLSVVLAVLRFNFFSAFLFGIWQLSMFALMVLGMINAGDGKMKRLPIIGESDLIR